MAYFSPKPDYETISKYYTLAGSPEDMLRDNPEGFLIEIDWWTEPEKIVSIENSFKAISKRYGLEEHTENLLFLVLCYYKTAEQQIDILMQEYQYSKRFKELASLILFLNNTAPTKFSKLTVASPFDAAKITDSSLINWMGQLVRESLKKGTFLISLFGFIKDDVIFDFIDGEKVLSTEKLKKLVDSPLKSPKSKYRELQADLCLYLYAYLKGETDILNNAAVMLPDALIHFYFDVLELLEYFDRVKIDSPAKDFMRAIIMNRIKKLNPTYKRK